MAYCLPDPIPWTILAGPIAAAEDSLARLDERLGHPRKLMAEHTKGARGSTKGKHEKGTAAKNRGRGGYKIPYTLMLLISGSEKYAV